MINNRFSFLFFVLLLPFTAHTQRKDSMILVPKAQIGQLYKSHSLNRISVHDPSVVKDSASNRYYIFGSHLAVASTPDLSNWSSVYWQESCNGMFGKLNTAGQVVGLYTYEEAFRTSVVKQVPVVRGGDTVMVDFGPFNAEAWTANSGTGLDGYMWAPDVVYNPNSKKYCLYLSINGDYWMSVIILLTSDNIKGPYVYQGPVVYSGFLFSDNPENGYHATDVDIVLNNPESLPTRYLTTTWANRKNCGWGNRWPNNIDPCVFFDDSGKLWMAYGSWSGGIFMLQLDAKTGLRDYTHTYPLTGSNDDITSDPYFGKKIAGGHYVSGEGPYIQKIGDYYYLFMSYGGLTSDGGYEMRIFRSSNPDGPYKDAKNISAIYSYYQMNYGPKATSNAGNRILGAYQWDNMSHAELAQGHNSAIVDDQHRAFVVYHTRSNDGTEGHQVRTHQLFTNKTNWLVATPFEFEGCTLTQDSIKAQELCSIYDIEGTYQILRHPYRMDYANKAFSATSVAYFHADGTVTGDYHGTWALDKGTSYITLQLAPEGTVAKTTYTGVVVPQTVSCTNIPTICFTTVAPTGVALWGSNAQGNYAIAYNYSLLKNNMPITNYQTITEDITFPNYSFYGITTTWFSSNPKLISDDGKLQVTPTTATTDPKYKLTITCRLQKDNYYFDVNRTVYVRCPEAVGIASVSEDEDKESHAVYDLSGRPVRKQNQGNVYIVNGKKILKY